LIIGYFLSSSFEPERLSDTIFQCSATTQQNFITMLSNGSPALISSEHKNTFPFTSLLRRVLLSGPAGTPAPT
jgi:hypothetical protein